MPKKRNPLKGLGVREVANRSGLNRGTIYYWINGRSGVTIEAATRITDAYNCTYEQVLEWINQQSKRIHEGEDA